MAAAPSNNRAPLHTPPLGNWATVTFLHKIVWFFVVSREFEDEACCAADRIDNGGEGVGIAVSTDSGASELDQPVKGPQAAVGIVGGPALYHAARLGLQGSPSHRLQARRVANLGPGVVQEVNDPPPRRPERARFADPRQLLLQLPGGHGVQPLLGHLGDRDQLVGGELIHVAALKNRSGQVVRHK